MEVSMEEVAPWSRFHSETGQKGEVVNDRSEDAWVPTQAPPPTNELCETLE